MEIIIVLVLIALMVGAFFAILKGTMKIAFKVLINTVLGFIALWIINFFGSIIGLQIGMNWINALIVGVFGLPGVALLLVLQWIFKS